jgi:hypothetical protein
MRAAFREEGEAAAQERIALYNSALYPIVILPLSIYSKPSRPLAAEKGVVL